MPTRPPPDSSDAEIDALAAVCERLAGFDERISLQWLDGYLIAVASAPLAVSLDDCLDRMLGDAFVRCFADPDDAGKARDAVAARRAVLAGQLDPEALLDEVDALRVAPLMDLWSDEDRDRLVSEQKLSAEEARALQSGQAWADGFLQACRDFEADWVPSHVDEDAQAERAGLLEQIAILGEAASSPALTSFLERYHAHGVPPTREDLLDEACFAVQDLRMWWLDHAPTPPTRRVAPAPGRNDPCPCGSGRKYKRCHGAAGAGPL